MKPHSQVLREKLRILPAEQIRPDPLISGDDLIQAGYVPGPQFKELLTAIEDDSARRINSYQGGGTGPGAAEAESRGPPEQAIHFDRFSKRCL